MQIFSIVLLVAVLFAIGVVLYLRRRQSHRICAKCSAPSHFGYSSEPESCRRLNHERLSLIPLVVGRAFSISVLKEAVWVPRVGEKKDVVARQLCRD
jgi:hypothetical protein